MTVLVTLFNQQANNAFAQECETFDEAFELLLTMITRARRLDKSEYPSVLPKLRDQTLLNLARWLTDGTFSPACEEVFIQLCARKERSADNNDVKMITAFGVADAMTEALTDTACWPDFDAKFDELKRLLTS